MLTENSIKKGKAIEYYLISELLKNDFDCYVPVTDVEGVDLIIKNRAGSFVEIQVKSRCITKEEDYFSIKNLIPRHNFFIVCHNINTNDFFAMPSDTFYRKSEEINVKREPFRKISYSLLKRYTDYKNDKGLALLKKAVEHPQNRVKCRDY